MACTCPTCGAVGTRSRRELFYLLMEDMPLPRDFAWYGERTPQACPPQSLFVILLLFLVGVSLPAIGFWLLGHYIALRWLSLLVLLLLGCLAFDVLRTYRQYKEWAGEWVCPNCCSAFQPMPELVERQIAA